MSIQDLSDEELDYQIYSQSDVKDLSDDQLDFMISYEEKNPTQQPQALSDQSNTPQSSDPYLDYVNSFSATDTPVEAEKTEFGKGLESAYHGLKSTGGGLIALAGDAFDSDDLREYGLDIYARNSEKAQESQGRVTDYEQIRTDEIGNFLEDATDYFMQGVGQMVPTAGMIITGGGVGGAIGKQVAKKAVTKYITERTGKQASEKAINKLTAQVLKKASQRGQNIGAVAGSTGFQTGSIYGEASEEGAEGAKAITASMGGGFISGILDVLPVVAVAKRFGFGGDFANVLQKKYAEMGRTRRMGEMGAKTGAQEFGTEAAQTWIEEATKAYILDRDIPDDIAHIMINTGLTGFAGGSTVGGLSGVINPGLPQTQKPINLDNTGLPYDQETPKPILKPSKKITDDLENIRKNGDVSSQIGSLEPTGVWDDKQYQPFPEYNQEIEKQKIADEELFSKPNATIDQVDSAKAHTGTTKLDDQLLSEGLQSDPNFYQDIQGNWIDAREAQEPIDLINKPLRESIQLKRDARNVGMKKAELEELRNLEQAESEIPTKPDAPIVADREVQSSETEINQEDYKVLRAIKTGDIHRVVISYNNDNFRGRGDTKEEAINNALENGRSANHEDIGIKNKGAPFKGRNEKYGIDVEISKSKDGYVIKTSDSNQRDTVIESGWGGIYQDDFILNMEGELIPSSDIVQGGTGNQSNESTPFKGSKQDIEKAKELLAQIDFYRNTGDMVAVEKLENELIDFVNKKYKESIGLTDTTGDTNEKARQTEATPSDQDAVVQEAQQEEKTGEVNKYALPLPERLNKKGHLDVDQALTNAKESDSSEIFPDNLESTLDQLNHQKTIVNNNVGRLNKGGKAGGAVSPRDTLSTWVNYNRLSNALEEYKKNNGKEWQAYKARQTELNKLSAGDTVVDSYGNEWQIKRKNRVNWSLKAEGKHDTLKHPSGLKAATVKRKNPFNTKDDLYGVDVSYTSVNSKEPVYGTIAATDMDGEVIHIKTEGGLNVTKPWSEVFIPSINELESRTKQQELTPEDEKHLFGDTQVEWSLEERLDQHLSDMKPFLKIAKRKTLTAIPNDLELNEYGNNRGAVVKNIIDSGGKVVLKDGGRILKTNDGKEFTQEQITKTAMDFAEDMQGEVAKSETTKELPQGKMDAKEPKEIGLNNEGQMVYEDKNGVRKVEASPNILVAQKISIIPGAGSTFAGHFELYQDGNTEFLTTEEVKAFDKRKKPTSFDKPLDAITKEKEDTKKEKTKRLSLIRITEPVQDKSGRKGTIDIGNAEEVQGMLIQRLEAVKTLRNCF